jgi:hypothetical protein
MLIRPGISKPPSPPRSLTGGRLALLAPIHDHLGIRLRFEVPRSLHGLRDPRRLHGRGPGLLLAVHAGQIVRDDPFLELHLAVADAIALLDHLLFDEVDVAPQARVVRVVRARRSDLRLPTQDLLDLLALLLIQVADDQVVGEVQGLPEGELG